MNRKLLPLNLTSYDLLKSFAVVLMVVDHFGYYFDDENVWLRVIGRFCVPVWFFLIGYARSRDVGPRMWLGAAILVVASGMAGIGILPLNILVTMLVIRVVIDPIMAHSQRTPQGLWQVSVMLLLLVFPSSYAFEYGTLAIIMAIFGWLVRNQHEYPDGVRQTHRFYFFALLSFVILQSMFFGFQNNEIIVFGVGTLVVMGGLLLFKPVVFSGTGEGLQGIITAPLRFMGRWTLEIYVAHLLLFKALGVYTQPDRFPLFDWKLVPQEMLVLTTSGVN